MATCPAKIFLLKIFRYGAFYEKVPVFTDFCLRLQKKKYQARVPTILMPQAFPIASLNRYTPNFSWAPNS